MQFIHTHTNIYKGEDILQIFKEYKDVFAWMYEDIKTYNMKIIKHIIPLKEDSKPFQ